MTNREHRLILRVLSVAEDLVRHSGENPAAVLSEYQQRLASAWSINPHDVSLSPRGTHEAGAELEELLNELHAAAESKN
jgi:hypothetical protein